MNCEDYKPCKGHNGVMLSHCLECTTGEKEKVATPQFDEKGKFLGFNK